MNSKIVIVDACVIIHAIDSEAESHAEASRLMIKLLDQNYTVVMPMHGLFEIQCTMRRFTKKDKRIVSSPFSTFEKSIKVRYQPIDEVFLNEFFDVDVPYAKAGDTIYMVMAKKLDLPLITRDGGMYKASKEAGIKVLTITEALNA